MTSKKQKPSKEKGLLAYIGLGLSYGLFTLVVLVGIAAVIVPLVTGATPLTVLTASMSPAYPPGTLIIIQEVEPEDIKIGDPITFQIKSGDPTVVTHRVIGIGHNATGDLNFVTKGDNNGAADGEPVRPEQIKGKIWYSIPYLGWLNTLMNGNNRAIIVPILAGALLLYAGYMFASSLVSKARKKRDGEPAATADSSDDLARREQELAQRERELELAERERELARRERELAAASAELPPAGDEPASPPQAVSTKRVSSQGSHDDASA